MLNAVIINLFLLLAFAVVGTIERQDVQQIIIAQNEVKNDINNF